MVRVAATIFAVVEATSSTTIVIIAFGMPGPWTEDSAFHLRVISIAQKKAKIRFSRSGRGGS